MFKKNKRNSFIILIIVTLISIIVIVSVNLILLKIYNQKKENKFNLNLKTNFNPNTNIEENIISKSTYKNSDWRIQISKINLDAPILEGTEKEILRRGVGHFKSTSKWDGNVCLAAHNRGYKYNYFAEIKKLEIGDIIEYKTDKRDT